MRPDFAVTHPVRFSLWLISCRVWAGLHSFVRDILVTLRIVRHLKRDEFHIGYIHEHRTCAQFIAYLESIGFGNHFIAWKETGQLASLRILDGFEYQYHVRVFASGEVRAHYETTPEFHPILHAKEIGFEDRREDFTRFFGDWIDPAVKSKEAA
jgi:hypothetical protein